MHTELSRYNHIIELVTIVRFNNIKAALAEPNDRLSQEAVGGHIERVLEDAWMKSGVSEQVDLIDWSMEFIHNNHAKLVDPTEFLNDPKSGNYVPVEGKKCYNDSFMYC